MVLHIVRWVSVQAQQVIAFSKVKQGTIIRGLSSKLLNNNFDYFLGICPDGKPDWVTPVERYYAHVYVGYCQGFTEIPPDIDEEATEIWIIGNQIQTLKANSFNHSSCLTLALSWNELETIEVGAFNTLDSIEGLHLDNNKLASLSPEIFQGLSSLKQLFLHNNNIESVLPEVLRSLQSLTEISLAGNELTTLDARTFEWMLDLNKIWIHENNIQVLPSGIFANLTKLRHLNLRDNELHTLNRDVFPAEKPTWFYLAISGNPLSCNSLLCWLYNCASEGWLSWWGGNQPNCAGLIAWNQMKLICGEEGMKLKMINGLLLWRCQFFSSFSMDNIYIVYERIIVKFAKKWKKYFGNFLVGYT